MRALLTLILLLIGSTSVSAQDKVEWWTEDGGKAVIYGVRESHFGGFTARCPSAGYDVLLGFPGAFPGRWAHGQGGTVSIFAAGREIGRVSGALIEDESEQQWILDARVGTDHPLFRRLFSGMPVVVGANGYPLNPEAGRDALRDFRSACAKAKSR